MSIPMIQPEGYRYSQVLRSHQQQVREYLGVMIHQLFRRASEHDDSKFDPEEFEPYAASLARFEQVEYGTSEYQECLAAIKPAIDHHFAHNRHHPEFYPDGINNMDLTDVIEMVCDWVAAFQRGTSQPVLRLDVQRERFGITEQLYGMICRTATWLVADAEVPIEIVY